MARLQIFNWGTFSGLHDVPIPDRGFLFVGRSGSGKSTLLDAIAALLVPPRWLDFNAAAREMDRTGRDRSLVTYVRGAWKEQRDDESGEIGKRYIRTGTTWSGLALTYRNPAGRVITLVQLFWIRGTSTATTDVQRHYFIFERAFDLKEVRDFPESNFDLRKLKQGYSDAFARDDFRPYCERFRRILGIESEMALRLLHKTQSAKNLGDLNTFLRDFMLDRPDTYDAADRLVTEFGELSAAHQAVVTAREQVTVLRPARETTVRHEELMRHGTALNEIEAGLTTYREELRVQLLEAQIVTWTGEAEGLTAEIQQQASLLVGERRILQRVEEEHRAAGGDRVEQWELERLDFEAQRSDRLRKRHTAENACAMLEWILPESPHDFANLVNTARQEVEGWQDTASADELKFALDRQKTDAEKSLASARIEVAALRRQPSNIRAEWLDMRRRIAERISVSESALPFVGELLQVRPEDARWQGAIERVLGGFARSVLVYDSHYAALSTYVNDVNLGERLFYYRLGRPEFDTSRALTPTSLVRKLMIKEGDRKEWLEAELRRRFDYACVDTLSAFRAAERAVTIQGQVKHGKSRHEKDDRRQVDDRKNWVLGFDNRDKLALFEEQVRQLTETVDELRGQLDRQQASERRQAARAIQCQTLVNLQWSDVDVATIVARLTHLDEQIQQARHGNRELREAGERLARQREVVNRIQEQVAALEQKLKTLDGEVRRARTRVADLRGDVNAVRLTPYQHEQLEVRFAKVSASITVDNLDRVTTTVVQGLSTERTDVNQAIHACVKEIEEAFAEFRRRWPTDAADLDATLASAPDFLAKLQRLETDGLPAYEQRFFELLQNQSHQNLAALSTHLSHARKTIRERMELVNESLRQAQFNTGTYLHIDASDRNLPEVKEFRQEIQQALNHAWSEDRELAESRFVTIRRLVERLGSQDPDQRRWRESVLDVRQHVEFVGRELDEAGRDVEIYRSGAGKSGGQRQKLATTCLAAALRYQLGGSDRAVPLYAPVVLDEAFDKADNEFTALAMNIFNRFGFQMIVATPLKSVMTLEPFIGGACFVDIADRYRSAVLIIDYDEDAQKLKLPAHVHTAESLEVS